MKRGHGHVTPNPSGDKARCGGPSICKTCKVELVALWLGTPTEVREAMLALTRSEYSGHQVMLMWPLVGMAVEDAVREEESEEEPDIKLPDRQRAYEVMKRRSDAILAEKIRLPDQEKLFDAMEARSDDIIEAGQQCDNKCWFCGTLTCRGTCWNGWM